MIDDRVLSGKHILVVDDEVDIVDSLAEALDMCRVDKALDFETARALLERNIYDAAVLDIMGVDGYALLKIAREKRIPALMLTAHALSPAYLQKSVTEGAYAYVPKERIAEIAVFLVDMIAAARNRVRPSGRWFQQLEPLFDNRFGSGWKSRDLQDELKRMFEFDRDELDKIL